VAPHVLATIVRLADETNGRLLRDPRRLAAILHRNGYDVPSEFRETLAARAAHRRPFAPTPEPGEGWWTILLDPASWPLMCEVIIEVRAALPIGYTLAGVVLWESGVPTVRQQRARARAIRRARAELVQHVSEVSPDQDAAWWKPDYLMPPITKPGKERTAFVVSRMQFHLVHDVESPLDAEPASDEKPQPDVVQQRLTLKQNRSQPQTKRGSTRRS
jgi:hypothetical protein